MATRAVSDNFKLETATFNSGGSMSENGKCQIVKRFLYNIVDNSPEMRRRAILDLETLVPAKESCMADDARYTLKSATWNCLDWRNQSTKFYIDATYRRVSDDDEASAPWNLAPFNIVTSPVEEVLPFRMAYNSKNKRCIPVVNSAADPFDIATKEIVQQYSFSFYARDYDIENVLEFSNSVNNSPQRILGQKYSAGTLFLMPFQVECLTTYEDDGYTEKWKYYKIDMSIRYREDGWQREVLDVGNRARFSSYTPEVIYQYYPFNEASRRFEVYPVWTDAVTYQSDNERYRSWRAGTGKNYNNLPANIPYEYGENIPLTSRGYVNSDILNTDITDNNFSEYPVRKFNEFKTLSWRSLDIPSEIKKNWRS